MKKVNKIKSSKIRAEENGCVVTGVCRSDEKPSNETISAIQSIKGDEECYLRVGRMRNEDDETYPLDYVERDGSEGVACLEKSIDWPEAKDIRDETTSVRSHVRASLICQLEAWPRYGRVP
jgi:hypothetical protein